MSIRLFRESPRVCAACAGYTACRLPIVPDHLLRSLGRGSSWIASHFPARTFVWSSDWSFHQLTPLIDVLLASSLANWCISSQSLSWTWCCWWCSEDYDEALDLGCMMNKVHQSRLIRETLDQSWLSRVHKSAYEAFGAHMRLHMKVYYRAYCLWCACAFLLLVQPDFTGVLDCGWSSDGFGQYRYWLWKGSPS